MKEVPAEVKSARLHKLLALAEKLKGEYEQKFIGKILEFVPEEVKDGYTEGYSENYIRLYLAGEYAKSMPVRAEDAFKDGLFAQIPHKEGD